MKSYQGPGHTLPIVAPVGGVTKDELVVINGIPVVPCEDAAQGAAFQGMIAGTFKLAQKATGFAPAVGDVAYLDTSTGKIEGSDTEDNRRVGVFAEAALSADTTCKVRLDAIGLGAGGDLEAKADKVVPTAAGNVAVLTAGGNLEDGGGAPITAVAGATEDNFASFDDEGLPKDSGAKAADFATAGHNHDSDYAAIGHDHDSTYAPKDMSGKIYACSASFADASGAPVDLTLTPLGPVSPAAGDKVFFVIGGNGPYTVGTDFAQVLVTGGKLRQLLGDYDADSGSIMLIKP